MSAVRHPLIELTAARFREFLREPEALFWAFAFPILMTCALGVAFRSGGSESIIVGVAQSDGHTALEEALAGTGFTVRRIETDDIDRSIRDGRAAVVVVPGNPPVYRFDEARPESQAARLAADAALQRAAGRTDAFAPLEQPIEAIGSRYVDWLVPGLIGMNIMSTGLWSVGFSIAQARMRKVLKPRAISPTRCNHSFKCCR